MIIPVWLISASLSLVGILLLIRGVKQILKAVGGPVLLRLPLTQKSGQFTLTQAGDYAIWQSGRGLQRIPKMMPTPTIISLLTDEMIGVHSSFSAIRVNNGWEGRIQLFTFQASEGQYKLDLPTDGSLDQVDSSYALEIRERKSGAVLVGGILLLILAAVCLLAGLILPLI